MGSRLPKSLWLAIPAIGVAATVYAANPPVDGEIVFTELMVEPQISGNEWIEIYSLASETRLLDGCVLIEGKSSTCTALGGMVGNCSTLMGDSAQLEIDPGERLVLAGSSSSLATVCGKTVDETYTKVSLNDNTDETMQLFCSNGSELVSVATITYNSSDSDKGFALELNEYVLKGGDLGQIRDFDASWQAASTAVPYCNNGSVTEYGTPRDANEESTPTPTPEPLDPPPAAGDVIFSELSTWGGSSGEGPDWIELHAVTADSEKAYDLAGCRLRGLKCDDGGFADEAGCRTAELDLYEKTKTSDLSPTGASIPVSAGGYLLLGSSSTRTCIAYDPADSEQCLVGVDATWSGVSAYSDDVAVLALECPDPGIPDSFVEVDRLLYNGEDSDFSSCTHEDGLCSWELKDDSLDAAGNDDALSWRYAGSAAVYQAYALSSYVPAYGTPRGPNRFGPACPVPDGGIIFTELVIWPSTSLEAPASPDWLELSVVAQPECAPYYLTECFLESYVCDAGASPFECAQGQKATLKYRSQVKPAEDQTPVVEAADLFLLGGTSSRFCVEVDVEGNCITPVNGSYSSTLGPSSTDEEPLRMIALNCPGTDGDEHAIDRVVFDKDWIAPTCGHADGRCSWELRPGMEDAAGNDDPAAWSAATASYLEPGGDSVRGTPGRENTVPAAQETAGPPDPGSVVISEMMIAPSSGSPEWLELQGATASSDGKPWELAGCVLFQVKGPDASACDPNLSELDTSLCKRFNVPPVLNLPIDVGQQRLLVDDVACLSFGEGGDPENPASTCLIPADVQYSGFDFVSGSSEVVSLWCPADSGSWSLIDAFPYNWDSVKAQCNTELVDTCSLSVHPDNVDADKNDRAFYRCVSPAGAAPADSGISEYPTWVDLAGALAAGTPGQPNVCPTLPRYPSPGDVIFTEIMIAPNGSDDDSDTTVNEWFELYNTTGGPLDLKTCTFVTVPVNPDGTLNIEKADDYPQSDNPATIGPTFYQVWVKNGCIAKQGDTCLFPTGETSEETTYPQYVGYASMSFTASSPTAVQLWCQGEDDEPALVDEMRYDYATSAIKDGHSWQLMPEHLDATRNDDLANWCEAAYKQKFFESPNGEGSYGSPGRENDCSGIEPFDGPGPGCRCDGSGGQRGSAGHLGVGLLAVLGLIRASRRHRRRPASRGAGSGYVIS